ncbi:secretion protein EspG [Mycolicibacterium novocastrense]|uniref:ESX secretion-associated protein EspG n=1 Tax=Mycolicibacterium novocastrense TaxID=59813 RepID=UPI000746A81D|nr:ESX secretion-associated protein EspG [Mycolicibacterium novocastrense]KUH72430.1 secretion protein EspG [Mycolicibacterium novocastrense]KUH72871.1 secretion protein EspG [Mycolicibacterium novocastrense]KUH77049.1 secretion protein EspG [Mycolicibacterium novocastrense]
MAVNAVELTAEQAWFVADASGAGSYPWVLAITPPYSDHAQRAAVEDRLSAELVEMGVMTADGVVEPHVRQWVTATCRPRRWLELRFVRGSGKMLRGHVARRDDETVVALRGGGLVTLSALEVDHPQAVVPILTAGLSGRPPARFDEFAIPARIGARADEKLRNGATLDDVIEFLGIPPSARAVVEAAYATDRSYVEIVAGDHRDGHRVSTDVGVSVVDTREGRVLVYPAKAFDGEWVSTFTPGTPMAIATAVERLTATLPDGAWFPDLRLTRDFDSNQRTEHQWQTV